MSSSVADLAVAGNHDVPATGRYRAAIHVGRVTIAVVEVVHLVIVDEML